MACQVEVRSFPSTPTRQDQNPAGNKKGGLNPPLHAWNSQNLGRNLFANMYFALTLVEFDNPVFQREQRIVAAAADIHAGMKPGAELTNQNRACRYLLSTNTFYATTLCITVATVAG